MRPIGLPPQAPVAQKIADQRWLIAISAKIGTFFIENDAIKAKNHLTQNMILT